jgi:hypothetical protein
LKEEIENKCQLCKQHEETIGHLTSECPILVKKEYITRHDKVCAHLHYSICKALGIATADKWYTHMPKLIYEEGDVTALWNQAAHTDREITPNRPDIIIKNKNKNENLHTDRCGNTRRQKSVQNQAEKKLKYKSLSSVIQRMWNLKCTIIPVITGPTGIVTRNLGKNLKAIPGKYSVDLLQKTAIHGISHIIRKVLQSET